MASVSRDLTQGTRYSLWIFQHRLVPSPCIESLMRSILEFSGVCSQDGGTIITGLFRRNRWRLRIYCRLSRRRRRLSSLSLWFRFPYESNQIEHGLDECLKGREWLLQLGGYGEYLYSDARADASCNSHSLGCMPNQHFKHDGATVFLHFLWQTRCARRPRGGCLAGMSQGTALVNNLRGD